MHRTENDEKKQKEALEATACSHVVLRAKTAIGNEISTKKCTAANVRALIEITGWAKQVRLATYSCLQDPDDTSHELDAITAAREEMLAKPGCDFLAAIDCSFMDAIDRMEGAPRSAACWGAVKLQLATPHIEELRCAFGELESDNRQYGVDDSNSRRFAEEWHALGRRCLATGHIPIVKKYARRGLPPTIRPLVWRLLLGLPNPAPARGMFSKLEAEYYAKLLIYRGEGEEERRGTANNDEISFLEDVKQSVADNDYYFPFEEVLNHVVVAFSRDPQHRSTMPRRGFVYYAAPLTFVYEREEPIYFALRAMYDRYWWKLHTLSTAPQTLLPLCKLFEQILLDRHPNLVHHLAVRLQVKPLAIAIPWIQFAFVTLLDVEQVLLLWDRIHGYGTLNLLPILAAAIFVFRSEQLLQATCKRDVEDVFHDCSLLKAIPLLQVFLWPDH